jgi:hypothetical protein
VQLPSLYRVASQSKTHRGGPEPRWQVYQQEAPGLQLGGGGGHAKKRKQDNRKGQRRVVTKDEARPVKVDEQQLLSSTMAGCAAACTSCCAPACHSCSRVLLVCPALLLLHLPCSATWNNYVHDT